MNLNTNGIRSEIIVTESRHMPGVEVVEIPGLGYWATRESAQGALDKLAHGICPMTHEVEAGTEPRRCRICGQMEKVAEGANNADPSHEGSVDPGIA